MSKKLIKITCKLHELCNRVLTSLFYRKRLEYLLMNSFQHHTERNHSATKKIDRAELTIMIPFRDKASMTIRCLKSIFAQEIDANLSVNLILINNGSTSDELSKVNSYLCSRSRFKHRLINYNEPFNFSKICNLAAQEALQTCTHFLFMNNDIELLNPNTLLESWRTYKKTANVGCLGICLVYPNQKIQHIFAAPGVKIVAAHPFRGKNLSSIPYWHKKTLRVPAVTGAYLMIERRIFNHIGGFDEALPTAGQDIDLCLKAAYAGYINIANLGATAVHHESYSRKGIPISQSEVRYIYNKWGYYLYDNPNYPKDLSRWSEQPAIRLTETPYPWKALLSG